MPGVAVDPKVIALGSRIDIPNYIHRSVFERRLFILFCLQNWYYSPDAQATKKFLERAAHILSEDFVKSHENKFKEVEAELSEFENFNKKSIEQMPIKRVDRFLVGLGINIPEADEKTIVGVFQFTCFKNSSTI